jgi:NAD(P)-dependent dehydrogenase (short-subunit alcohol dehydrogenase family)
MNKHVLITGGSRGIGAATVRHLAGQGYHLCINYRRDRQAAEATADIWMKKGRPSAPFSFIRRCCISLPQQQLPDRQHMAPFGQ